MKYNQEVYETVCHIVSRNPEAPCKKVIVTCHFCILRELCIKGERTLRYDLAVKIKKEIESTKVKQLELF